MALHACATLALFAFSATALAQGLRDVVPATMHAGTTLMRDAVPFVGKVHLSTGPGEIRQFTCVLTGTERRACVTTAHSLLENGDLLSAGEADAEGDEPALTVEFEACGQVYRAEATDLATTGIDAVTERNREKDIAIVTLSEPVCDRVAPAVLLPRLDRSTAEKWLLPGAEVRVPVTIPAYYQSCVLGIEGADPEDDCEQYSSTGFIDAIAYLGGQPIYETWSIGTLPGSSGAPGLVIDTGRDATTREDDTYFWICLNVGHRPGGQNACIALENGSFARRFLESRIAFSP